MNRADFFSKAQAAPALDGDKIMRLRSQTAKIEGGFVLFPKEAPWLDTYLNELVTFPNAKNDDQVDSTVFALAWSTPSGGAEGRIEHYKRQAEAANGSQVSKMIPVLMPPGISTYYTVTGRSVAIPNDRIIEVTEEELTGALLAGGKRVD